jgi:inner membrane protein
MDNLTHTVIGVAAGAAAAHIAGRLRARPDGGLTPATRNFAFIAIGMIGGNLPDSDLLVSYGDGKLGYLLQHRGYTHTFLGCLALALVLFCAVLATLRARRQRPDAADLRGLAAMSLLAVFLHLGMDALNSYGVHPYWPLDNRWSYGDSVFIVEPWYWIAAAPLLFAVRARLGRIALGVLLFAALAANVLLHRGEVAWLLGVAGLTAMLVLVGRRCSAQVAAWSATALMAAVTLCFTLAGRDAARETEALALRSFPGESLIDHVLTPLPTHPFCWDLLLLQRDATRYIARRALLATGPQASVAACPRLFPPGEGSAPWQPAGAEDTTRVRWLGEMALPLGQLADLVAGHCAADALMQFVRAPFAVRRQGRWLIGDLRFDREADAGFAELELDPAAPPGCPRPAPWVPPRAELLGPAADAGARMNRAGGRE